MTRYKYRWCYVIAIFLSVIVISFFYDVQPQLEEIASLQVVAKQTTAEMARLKEHVNKYQHSFTNVIGAGSSDLYKSKRLKQLADIYILAHQSGLIIQSVNLLPQKSLEFTTLDALRVVAVGRFDRVAAFLFLMTLQPNVGLITDFSYQAEQHDQFVINMDILFWLDGVKTPLYADYLKKVSPHFNPFCLHENAMITMNDVALLQRIPLTQIKMVGYLRQANQVSGIVSLANGMVFDISNGFVLGREHGVVKEIRRDHIVVEVGKGKRLVLKMESD